MTKTKKAIIFISTIVILIITNCKHKNTIADKLDIEELIIDKQPVDIKEPEELIIKKLYFSIKTNMEISSIDIQIKSETKNYLVAKNLFSGKLENILPGEKTTVKFIVHSNGKEDTSITIPIFFNPHKAELKKIYVDSGYSNSSACLNDESGNFVVASENSDTVLMIETGTDASEVIIASENGAEEFAEKEASGRFRFNIKNLTNTPRAVTLTAKAPEKKDNIYSFKIKKGKTKIGIKQIRINEDTIEPYTALKPEGCSVSFYSENPLKNGTVKITAVLEEPFTNIEKTSSAGFIKDSYLHTLNKKEFEIQTLSFTEAFNEKETLKIKAVENIVTFNLQAPGREDTVIKFIFKDENKNIPPYGNSGVGMISKITKIGDYWNDFVTKPDWALALPTYGRAAEIQALAIPARDFILFSKEPDGWVKNESSSSSGGFFSDLKCVIGILDDFTAEKTFDTVLVYEGDKSAAVKVPIKVKSGSEFGFSFDIFDSAGYPKNEEEWKAVSNTSIDAIKEMLTPAGKTYTIHKNKFTEAFFFEFEWLTARVKILQAEMNKYIKDKNVSAFPAAVKTDTECRNLIEKGFYLIEKTGTDSGTGPLNFEENKTYKYVFTLKVDEFGTEKNITITTIINVEP